ncbi:hypothetical protein N9933_02160, partial [bacterium]|nr:hypothetical protein [bacterium]
LYQVRVNGMPEVFSIDREKEETYLPFYEFVFKTVIESYHTGLDRLVQEKTTNRIGFDLNEITSSAIKKEP